MDNSIESVDTLESYTKKCNGITSNLETCTQSNSSFKSILNEIKNDLDSASIGIPLRGLILHFFNAALPSFIKIFMSLQ